MYTLLSRLMVKSLKFYTAVYLTVRLIMLYYALRRHYFNAFRLYEGSAYEIFCMLFP